MISCANTTMDSKWIVFLSAHHLTARLKVHGNLTKKSWLYRWKPTRRTNKQQTIWSRHTQAQSEIPFGTEDLSCVFFFSPLDFVYLFRFWLHSVCIRSSEVIRAPFCLTVGLQIKTLKKQTKKKNIRNHLTKSQYHGLNGAVGSVTNTTELAEYQARLRHAKPLTELYEVHTQATPNLFTQEKVYSTLDSGAKCNCRP